MNFRERKTKGNRVERAFQRDFPEAIRTSSFAEDDFTTKTGDMSVKLCTKCKKEYEPHNRKYDSIGKNMCENCTCEELNNSYE